MKKSFNFKECMELARKNIERMQGSGAFSPQYFYWLVDQEFKSIWGRNK